jgi:DNA modification methylase
MGNSKFGEMTNKFVNTVNNIDCINGFKEIDDESIDLILTDPPYGLNTNGINNDTNLDYYYSILPESFRVLKKDAYFITFFSTKYLPYVFNNNPFKYFWNFVLYCPNGQVNSPIGYTKYMSCVVFKKGNPKMIKRSKDIFVDTPGRMVEPDEGFIDHPTPKPKTFIMEILKMFSKEGDLVLDPFIGSGATAVACKLTNRKFIGFEIEKKYYQLSIKRLKRFENGK